MRARVKRSAFVAVLGLTALAGCGGAGGGGPDTPTIPGTLAALALEGGTAPGTTGGTFGAFGPTTLLAVADETSDPPLVEVERSQGLVDGQGGPTIDAVRVDLWIVNRLPADVTELKVHVSLV